MDIAVNVTPAVPWEPQYTLLQPYSGYRSTHYFGRTVGTIVHITPSVLWVLQYTVHQPYRGYHSTHCYIRTAVPRHNVPYHTTPYRVGSTHPRRGHDLAQNSISARVPSDFATLRKRPRPAKLLIARVRNRVGFANMQVGQRRTARTSGLRSAAPLGDHSTI